MKKNDTPASSHKTSLIESDDQFNQHVLGHFQAYMTSRGRTTYEDIIHRHEDQDKVISIVTLKILEEFPGLPSSEDLPKFSRMIDYIFDISQSKMTPKELHPKIIETLKMADLDWEDSKQVEAYKELFLSIHKIMEPSLLQKIRFKIQFGFEYDVAGNIKKHLHGEKLIKFVRAYLS